MNPVKVGILGATGTVGQRFIQLLAGHPFFVIAVLGASPRSAGKRYIEQTAWKLPTSIPQNIQDMVIKECKPEHFVDCTVVFSGLDSDVAGEIETAFMKADLVVFSNAKNHRMDPLVPLCVPLVNADHMQMLQHQRAARGTKQGCIVTNANCSTTGMVVALKALQDAFGPIDKIMVTTLQAISGAGYPGVASLDIFDNVVPYIGDEEPKLETEPNKILGAFDAEGTKEFVFENMCISATCNRVPVIDGHTECISVSFKQRPAPTVEQVNQAFERFAPNMYDAPSAPDRAIYVKHENNRPQPRLDRDNGRGQAVTVGRVRTCNILDIKFTLLSHNTILGAAGSSIMNAEIAVLNKWI